MPRLDEATQAARRDNILDAAETCFVRDGFHRTSMHDICREAGVSPGALYIYFTSKEALIAGLCAREQMELAADLDAVEEAPDLLAAMRSLADAHCLQSHAKCRLRIDMTAEALRNPAIAEIVTSIDAFVLERFEALLTRARDAGRIAPTVPIPVLARLLALIGDGLLLQSALDESFDREAVLPAAMEMAAAMLKPCGDVA